MACLETGARLPQPRTASASVGWLAGGVVGLLNAARGVEMRDGGAGLLSAEVSGLMQGSQSDTLMMPRGATGKSRGCGVTGGKEWES